MRIIPGKTKVGIELFRGITIADMIIGTIGFGLIVLVVASSLPAKMVFCCVIFVLFALMLVRIDDEPMYKMGLHMILHFLAYKRHYSRLMDDATLQEMKTRGHEEVAFDRLFKEKHSQAQPVIAYTKADAKALKKAEKAERKADDKLLRSHKLTKEQEDAIWLKRAQQSAAKKAAKKAKKSGKMTAAPVNEEVSAQVAEQVEQIMEDNKAAENDTPAETVDNIPQSGAMDGKKTQKRIEADESSMDDIIGFTDIKNGLIVYERGYYGAVIEIPAVEFRFYSQYRRDNAIENALGSILRGIHPDFSVNIIKLDRPLYFDSYAEMEKAKIEDLRRSYENGVLKEDEFQARVEVIFDRINDLNSLNSDNRVVVPFYYIALYDKNAGQLRNHVADALRSLKNGGMNPHRLDDKELAIFLRYSNSMDFDERDIEKILPEDYAAWAKPQSVEIKNHTVIINDVITHNFRMTTYPLTVGDSWLAGVMSLPGTKVVIKAKPMDSARSVRTIDHSLQELRGQYMNTGVDSKRIELANHIESLEQILATLQNENESLLCTNVYITAYDIVASRADPALHPSEDAPYAQFENFKKLVRRTYRESGFRLNSLQFCQTEAFIGSQVNGYDPFYKEGRGIPSNTVAATFPWIYASIADPAGIKFGDSDGVPVFIDFFRRDSERVNSNMVIVGKSGSGKSYATKSILTNLAAEDSKIFVLDPEDEYVDLAKNLHGKYINVGNAQYGRLNPFQIITALDDDEEGTDTVSGSYATHLQFLEEFFTQILPDCNKDALEYLNAILDRLYTNMGITAETDLRTLRPEDYPIFDDLYDAILEEFQASNNDYIRTMLRTLMNYVSKFAADGRNANIWNGPSTVTTEENFTVFNFQSLLANRNGTIANAQMLLVLKYIDNEIIKNREYNTKYNAKRKIVVVIDEAHVFIDTKYPVALDFMFQLAKRIRKYNGMQIVITQNIKDFVGSEEIARKSTAIINACQYSFIFSLAPNDMTDLCKLYEKAGGINEVEQEEIITAPRGQAFTVMSAQSRSTFQIRVPEDTVRMFRSGNFQSEYFSSESGREYWEEFVEDSRPKFEVAYAERHPQLDEEEEEMVRPKRQRVSFSELTEEELLAENASKESPLLEEVEDFNDFNLEEEDEFRTPTGGKITFSEIDEADIYDRPAAPVASVAPTSYAAPTVPNPQMEQLLAQMSGVMQTMQNFSYEAIMGRVQDMVASQIAGVPAQQAPMESGSLSAADDGDFNLSGEDFDFRSSSFDNFSLDDDDDGELLDFDDLEPDIGPEIGGSDTVRTFDATGYPSGDERATLGNVFDGLDEFDEEGTYRGPEYAREKAAQAAAEASERSSEPRQVTSVPENMDFNVAGFDFMQQLAESVSDRDDDDCLSVMERNNEQTRTITLEELTILINNEKFKANH